MGDLNRLVNTSKFQEFKTAIVGKCSIAEYAKNIGIFITQGWKNGLITNENWENVIDKLDNIALINDIPVCMRGIYGNTFTDCNTKRTYIQINPELGEFRRRQYFFHELIHAILSGEGGKMIENIVSSNTADSQDENTLRTVGDGYTAIEESIAQEVSEILVYSSYGQERPQPQIQRDPVLGNTQVISNWEFYGLYQPIGTAFAKTLRGIGSLQGDKTKTRNDKVMSAMCQRALNGDFAKNIITEYKNDGQLFTLCKVLLDLANVYNVKRASFGASDLTLNDQTLKISEQSYNEVLKTLRVLEDHRPPIYHKEGNTNRNPQLRR